MASQIVAQAPLFVKPDDAGVMDQVEIGIEDPQPDLGAVEKAFVNARKWRQIASDWSQPHSHPNEPFITALAGTFLIGTGPKFDKNKPVAVWLGQEVTVR